MNKAKARKAGDMLEQGFRELSDKFFECPKHGMYHGKPVKYSWGYNGTETTVLDPECPKCAAEREAREAEESGRRKQLEDIGRLESMNIGEKFWNSTFENFDAYNDELKHHLETARRFAEKPNGKLVMIGENGNGKNHLAAAILKKAGGIIYTCFEIGVMLRDCYNGRSSEAELFYRLCSVPLLVIDELDKAKESEAKNNWMSHVIGKRYNNMLPIVLIANGHLQDDCKSLKKPCPKCIECHLENDVISRVFEDSILMKFNSADYRYHLRTKMKGEKWMGN
jgi:DNA replication protein DnaC